MLAVAISTVAGRFRMTGRVGVGSQTSITASQISSAKSSSVPVKLSGEYSHCTSHSGIVRASFWHSWAALTAMSTMPARSRPNTTRRCSVEVEL